MESSLAHRRPGLFYYLLVRVLPLAAVVMGAVSFIGLKLTNEIALRKANDLLVRQSKQTKTVIQARIDNILSQTKIMSDNALLVNGLIDLEGRNDYLPEFFRTLRLAGHPSASIEMTDYKGRPVFNNSILHFSDLRKNEWQKSVVQKGEFDSRLMLDGFTSIAPILYAGNAEGAVVVSLNQAGLFNLLDTGTQYNDTLIVGAEGKIIFSSDSRFGAIGEIYPEEAPEDRLIVPASLTGYPGVRLITLQWRDSALASQQWIQNFLIVGTLVSLMVLCIAIALTAYLTKRDVSGLSAIVRKIRGTEDMKRRITPSGPAELYALGVDLNTMMEALLTTTTSFEYVDSIISNTSEGIVTVDIAGKIETFNQAAENIFDYSASETIGFNVSMLMQPGEGTASNAGELNSAFFNTYDVANTCEITGVRKDGALISIELNVASMSVDGTKKYIGIFRDISERKQYEKDLVESKKRAEQANLAKSNFLSTMSHEIRTPLNGVLGLAQILRDTKLDDDQRHKVGTILTSGQTLLSIINDVLDMSRIEAGGMELEVKPFELKDLISSVSTPFQSLADDKGLTLTVLDRLHSSNVVKGDPVRLRQVLWNLLSNAIKFTEKGSVKVTIEALENTSGLSDDENLQLVRFSVQDSGSGIAPDRIGAIFDAFTQEDSSITRKHGGTGLGLSIVSQLTELMGGTIDAESELGQGTIFNVIIPFEMASQEDKDEISKHKADDGYQNISSLKVLVAEDNEVNAIIARSFLEKFGHKVRHVENGLLAVEEAQTGWADVILMDVHMPEMNGLDATKTIRENETGIQIPIIGLTAEAFQERHTHFIESGMNAVLTKPFTKQQLADVLSRHFTPDASSHDSGVKANHRLIITSDNEAGTRPDEEPIIISDNVKTPASNLETIGDEKSLKELRDLVGAGKITALLEEAENSVQKRFEQIRSGLLEEDSGRIREAAHALKGVSGSLFATRLSNIAQIVEQNSSDFSFLRGQIKDFEDVADVTISWWLKHAAIDNV